MTEKTWTNAYIIGMYLLKHEEIKIKKVYFYSDSIYFSYKHKRYGNRGVSIENGTHIGLLIESIDYDWDYKVGDDW